MFACLGKYSWFYFDADFLVYKSLPDHLINGYFWTPSLHEGVLSNRPCPSVGLSVCLSVCPSVCPSLNISETVY